MTHTRPWSDEPLKTLENKYQLAIDLAFCCEKLVHQVAIIRDTLPIAAAELSDSAAETIKDATTFVTDVARHMLPSSLLRDSLNWFREHQFSDAEKQSWISVSHIAASSLSEFKDNIPMLVSHMKVMATTLARFRDELKSIVGDREAGTSPNELRFRVVENGAMLYGVYVPVTKLLLTLLKNFHDIERECTYEKIAGWHTTWKDKYENREGDAAERDISKRIGELNSKLRKAFCLGDSSNPIGKRKPNDETLWQLNLPMLKEAALKLDRKK